MADKYLFREFSPELRAAELLDRARRLRRHADAVLMRTRAVIARGQHRAGDLLPPPCPQCGRREGRSVTVTPVLRGAPTHYLRCPCGFVWAPVTE